MVYIAIFSVDTNIGLCKCLYILAYIILKCEQNCFNNNYIIILKVNKPKNNSNYNTNEILIIIILMK